MKRLLVNRVANAVQIKRKKNKTTAMPYINLQITKGATRDQKKKIVEEFTASLVNHLGKKPEHIHIVIDEVEDENWGYAGKLTDDYRKTQNNKK